jgi:hypothetical protein
MLVLCSQVDQDQIKDVIPSDTLVFFPGRLAEKMEGAGKLHISQFLPLLVGLFLLTSSYDLKPQLITIRESR